MCVCVCCLVVLGSALKGQRHEAVGVYHMRGSQIDWGGLCNKNAVSTGGGISRGVSLSWGRLVVESVCPAASARRSSAAAGGGSCSASSGRSCSAAGGRSCSAADGQLCLAACGQSCSAAGGRSLGHKRGSVDGNRVKVPGPEYHSGAKKLCEKSESGVSSH